jgi:hypothetical protein
MKLTSPQRRLLKEGELYGSYLSPRPGKMEDETPIDQLISDVQSHFIDWDLNNEKFMKLFYKSHPHATPEYLGEMGGVYQVLMDELPGANQPQRLIDKLIKRTNEPSSTTNSYKLEAPVSELDLSVRARYTLEDMNIQTIGDLISTPKSEIIKHRNVGRTTIRELTRKVEEFKHNLETYSLSLPGGETARTADEAVKALSKWVESDQDTPWGGFPRIAWGP